jgi:hypothetical protein
MEAEIIEPAAPAKPDHTLLAILIVVALLLVIAVVVVLVRTSARATLDAASPEGVVQRYSQAVLDGDDATAAKYFKGSPDDCGYYDSQSDNLRLTFKSTHISGDTATVRVTVSQNYGGGPFSNYEYSTDERFTLVKSSGTWVIIEAPYEIILCDSQVTPL